MSEIESIDFPRYDLETITRKIRRVTGKKPDGLALPENVFLKVMALCEKEYKALGKPIPPTTRFLRNLQRRCHLSYQQAHLNRVCPDMSPKSSRRRIIE